MSPSLPLLSDEAEDADPSAKSVGETAVSEAVGVLVVSTAFISVVAAVLAAGAVVDVAVAAVVVAVHAVCRRVLSDADGKRGSNREGEEDGGRAT